MRSAVVLAVSVAYAVAAELPADAGPREMCRPGAMYRGATIDLDVKAADIHDVMRLLADVGRVNVVVAAAVTGKVTITLRRVPWDQVACTIASLHKLRIVVDRDIVLVRPRSGP